MIPDTVKHTWIQILSRKEILLLLEGQVGTASRLGRDSDGPWHTAVFKSSSVGKEKTVVLSPRVGVAVSD